MPDTAADKEPDPHKRRLKRKAARQTVFTRTTNEAEHLISKDVTSLGEADITLDAKGRRAH